jgi:hypothetical protein
VCGSIRIAQWDCDTNSPAAFRDAMLDWMCETLNAALASQPQAVELSAMSRHSRAMLLNVIWHHQSASSTVGQPLRAMLGIGQHDRLDDEQLAEAKWIDGLLARAGAQPQAEDARDAMARRLLWIAFVWNDHNFGPAHEEARSEARRHGITSLDDANAWLDGPKLFGGVVLMDEMTAVQSIRSARLAHRCDWCWQMIPAGTEYKRYRYFHYGDAGTCKMHPECYGAMCEAADEEGGWLEFTPGQERPEKST